jgi:ankyrin repeat protein
MNKKIIIVLLSILLTLSTFCNENLLKKTISEREAKKIWSKIEVIKTTKKEILEILERYKLNSINLLYNKNTGQLAFSFEYKDNKNNLFKIAFLIPGTYISDTINLGDIVIDVFPRFTSNQKTSWFPIYKNNDWKTLKENIELDKIKYQYAISFSGKNIENYINSIQDKIDRQIFHIFLDHIYNTNSFDNKVLLFYSIIYNYPELLLKIIKKVAKIDYKLHGKKSSLIFAIFFKSPETAKILINNGCDINIIDEDKMSPLLYALKNKYPDIALILINKGADINIKNKKEETPLLLAIESKYPKIVKLLINKGVEINTRLKNVYTPLMYAIRYSTPEIVEILIDNNAKFSEYDEKDKLTPLIYSLLNSKPEIAKILIKKGANVNAKNKAGESPLKLAKKHGYNEIVNLLKKYGAKE